MISLTLISTSALVVAHDQSLRYQQRINQTTKQLEEQRAKQRTQLEQQMHDLQIQNDAKQKMIDDLNSQLQAKKDSQNVIARAASAAVNFVAPAAYASGDSAKLFIYNHESGNNPTKWNSSGCLGLGQACPASKLLAVCPNMDYACEDNWFTGYMSQCYGTWEAAQAYWLCTGSCTNKYGTTYKTATWW